MDADKIKSALADVTAEQDPTLKSAKLASLCSALWAERGVELVVVGGSAIEILTEGAYASGDLDMCHATRASLPVRERRKSWACSVRKAVRATGRWPGCIWICSARWKALPAHLLAASKRLTASFLVMKPEDLLVERVLMSFYLEKTRRRATARRFDRGLAREVEMDWDEVRRLANLPEYRNLSECVKLVKEVADELKIKSPLHPD